MGDVVGAGDVAHRLAGVATAQDFFDLMRCQLGRPAHLHAAGLGAEAAFAGPRADQFALKLRQPAQHRQHEATVRRRGIGPCVTKGTEPGLAVGDRGKGIEKIPRRSRQPVEPG